MKTSLTLVAILFSLFVSAQDKHKISSFFIKYSKVPNYPITQIDKETEYAIDLNLEFGKETKLKNEIAALKLFDQKKVSKADLTFSITIKEPVPVIEEKKAKDETYYYTYQYFTTCFIEAKKGGEIVDTVSFKIKGEKIKTMSAAPIAIVDKSLKLPPFKMKANKAKTKSVGTALTVLRAKLSEEYSYYKSSLQLSYNQYVNGAQGSSIDYKELNSFYNNYKETVNNYATDREGTKAKLNDILAKANELIETKNSEGKHYFNFMELHHIMVVKLEILTLQYNFEEANKIATELNADKKGLKTSQSKVALKNLANFKAKFNAAKSSGLDFKY